MITLKNKRSIHLVVTSAYAPTEMAEDQKRVEFWSLLTTHQRQIPKRAIRVLGTDANGHIGLTNPEPVMPHTGTFGATSWNKNGRSLSHFLTHSDMAATNTYRSCHNPSWTWQSSDMKSRTKIDYMCLSSTHNHRISQNIGAV